MKRFTGLYFNRNAIEIELSFGKNIKLKNSGKAFYLCGWLSLNVYHFQIDPLPENLELFAEDDERIYLICEPCRLKTLNGLLNNETLQNL